MFIQTVVPSAPFSTFVTTLTLSFLFSTKTRRSPTLVGYHGGSSFGMRCFGTGAAGAAGRRVAAIRAQAPNKREGVIAVLLFARGEQSQFSGLVGARPLDAPQAGRPPEAGLRALLVVRTFDADGA